MVESYKLTRDVDLDFMIIYRGDVVIVTLQVATSIKLLKVQGFNHHRRGLCGELAHCHLVVLPACPGFNRVHLSP